MNNPIIRDGEAMPSIPTPEYYAAWAKARELGKQLSEVLRDTGDNDFAYIRPAGTEFAVCFGNMVDKTYGETIVELPVDKVERLSRQLSVALDDWNGQTNIRFMAHVYPASSGRDYYYENTRRDADLRKGSEAASALTKLLTEAGRIIRANPELQIDSININEHGVHTFRKIPGVAAVTSGESK